MTSFAAIFDGPGLPFRLNATELPALERGELLVRVTLCTVCGSDLHTVAGSRTEPTPCVLGHEAVGIVEAMNGRIDDTEGEALHVGDRVVWTVAASCGHCFYCMKQLPQKCETLKKYGHVRHVSGEGPRGGFATHVQLWPGTGIVKLPTNLPDTAAAPAACAAATVAAAIRVSGSEDARGAIVVVLGAGMLGLTACAMAHTMGATVMVFDTDDARLTLAKRFGATHALASDKSSLGRGADLVLEFTGSTAVTEMGFGLLRIGGTMILAGAVFPTEPLALVPEQLIRKLITIRGIHNYRPDDLRFAVRFLEANHAQFPFAELVETQFPLVAINEAMAYASANRPVRIGLLP